MEAGPRRLSEEEGAGINGSDRSPLDCTLSPIPEEMKGIGHINTVIVLERIQSKLKFNQTRVALNAATSLKAGDDVSVHPHRVQKLAFVKRCF